MLRELAPAHRESGWDQAATVAFASCALLPVHCCLPTFRRESSSSVAYYLPTTAFSGLLFANHIRALVSLRTDFTLEGKQEAWRGSVHCPTYLY